MVDKLLPGNETILVVPAIEINGVPHLVGATLAPLDAPTVAILNMWAVIKSPGDIGAGAGGNVSCAVKDDRGLGLTDSSTDGDRTVCSVGQSEELTFYNFDAELTGFTDLEIADSTSAFNLFRDLTFAPDVPYVIVHRIGKGPDELFAIGDEIDLYYAHTDHQVPTYADGANLTVTQSFSPKNLVNIAHVLAA